MDRRTAVYIEDVEQSLGGIEYNRPLRSERLCFSHILLAHTRIICKDSIAFELQYTLSKYKKKTFFINLPQSIINYNVVNKMRLKTVVIHFDRKKFWFGWCENKKFKRFVIRKQVVIVSILIKFLRQKKKQNGGQLRKTIAKSVFFKNILMCRSQKATSKNLYIILVTLLFESL